MNSNRCRNQRSSNKREDTIWDRYMRLYTGDNESYNSKMRPKMMKSRENFKNQEGKRTFALRLKDDEILYVNPYFFETISEDFRRRFKLIDDPYGTIAYDDINVHEMHLLLSSVCPDLYHLYPTPIIMPYLPALLPLAKKLEMPNLLLCCEKVLENDLEQNENCPTKLLSAFDFAYKYGFGVELQAKLLQRLLKGKFPDDIADENLFFQRTGHILALAHIKYLKKKFAHNELRQLTSTTIPKSEFSKKTGVQTIKCSNCLLEHQHRTPALKKHRRSRKSVHDAVVKCGTCGQHFCARCLRTACTTMLVEFLKKYTSNLVHKTTSTT